MGMQPSLIWKRSMSRENAEGIVSREFSSKSRICIDWPLLRADRRSSDTNRIAIKARGAKLFFGVYSRCLYGTEGCSPVVLNGVVSGSNNSCRSEDVERRNGRFSYKCLADFAKLNVTRPTDVN